MFTNYFTLWYFCNIVVPSKSNVINIETNADLKILEKWKFLHHGETCGTWKISLIIHPKYKSVKILFAQISYFILSYSLKFWETRRNEVYCEFVCGDCYDLQWLHCWKYELVQVRQTPHWEWLGCQRNFIGLTKGEFYFKRDCWVGKLLTLNMQLTQNIQISVMKSDFLYVVV